MKKIIYLASQSPRRQMLLKEILSPSGITFHTLTPDYKECTENVSPEDLVIKNSVGKATAVSSLLPPDSLVIGSDTTVVLNNQFLGKPVDAIQAKQFLTKLSGNSHSVYTGVALLDLTSHKLLKGVEQSIVTFKVLTEEKIEWYVKTKEPFDKAGAYAVQGEGISLIQKIEGSYSNIVGFPKSLVRDLLTRSGIFI